ncbi:proteasome assembly chaperone 2-like [Hydra vulgaris]|uniref:Proteasome assembly chaperone 2 n=1 Tax=Hydra vulgaris TaxID=6087 RepID=A0ABM4DA22_HYDVU
MEVNVKETESNFVFSNSVISGKWIGYTFIMTSVSFGNVSQLTTDLLLEHLDIVLLGFIIDDAVLPVTGPQPFSDGSHKLCASLEVFECREHSLIIVQQRAPFIKGRITAFCKKLFSWIDKSCFSKVVMYAGLSSHIRNDCDLQRDSFRFLTTDLELKKKMVDDLCWEEYSHKKTDGSITLPGSGIIKLVYEECNKRLLKFTALLVYCVPGYEFDDVILLLSRLQILLNMKFAIKSKPPSWNNYANENIF